MPLPDEPSLPAEEQELLADTWMQALDLLAQDDPAAGLTLLLRGIERARNLQAAWQPAVLLHWQLAAERYPAARHRAADRSGDADQPETPAAA